MVPSIRRKSSSSIADRGLPPAPMLSASCEPDLKRYAFMPAAGAIGLVIGRIPSLQEKIKKKKRFFRVVSGYPDSVAQPFSFDPRSYFRGAPPFLIHILNRSSWE
ncbi:hypothetical protein CULT_1730008 [[Clostridium] ultunense Esp]|nr:hypothetical protein CULT_1730008 [[Clostridium] ultunense Esp]